MERKTGSENISDFMYESIKKRRERRAREIALEIDPMAGGFFRSCMERAALLGMEYSGGSIVGNSEDKSE